MKLKLFHPHKVDYFQDQAAEPKMLLVLVRCVGSSKDHVRATISMGRKIIEIVAVTTLVDGETCVQSSFSLSLNNQLLPVSFLVCFDRIR